MPPLWHGTDFPTCHPSYLYHYSIWEGFKTPGFSISTHLWAVGNFTVTGILSYQSRASVQLQQNRVPTGAAGPGDQVSLC